MKTTTVKQGKNLLSLGLNPGTADYYYKDGRGEAILMDKNYNKGMDIVSWSFTRLIELLPGKIRMDRYYCLNLEYLMEGEEYRISYLFPDNHQYFYEVTSIGKDLLGLAYDMMSWVLQNGLIEKEEK